MDERLKAANDKRYNARSRLVSDRKAWQGKECEIEKMCESYLKLKRLRHIHIPDNMLRYLKSEAPIWIKSIVSNAFKGIPDLLIFKGSKSLLIELKTAKGKESQGQKDWRSSYKIQDVTVHLVRDFETFKELVDEFDK